MGCLFQGTALLSPKTNRRVVQLHSNLHWRSNCANHVLTAVVLDFGTRLTASTTIVTTESPATMTNPADKEEEHEDGEDDEDAAMAVVSM
jgi:hypothetical protein